MVFEPARRSGDLRMGGFEKGRQRTAFSGQKSQSLVPKAQVAGSRLLVMGS